MTPSETKRPLALWALIGCLGFLSLGGFIGGVGFIADPTGKLIQMGLEPLQKLGLPIQDYFWPGVFLLLTFGILPLLVGYSLLVRPEVWWATQLNWWRDEHWALTLCLLLSAVLIVWIGVEVSLIGLTQLLQPVLALLGFVMLGLVLLPSMRKYYSSSKSPAY